MFRQIYLQVMEIADMKIESLLYQETLTDVMAEKDVFTSTFYSSGTRNILESENIFTERLIVPKTRRLIIIFVNQPSW